MKGEQRPQIDVAEIVGVDDHDLVGNVGKVGIGGDRAGRAQKHGLVRFDQVKPSFGIDPRDIITNLLGLGMGVDPGLADPRLRQAIDPVIQEGAVKDRHQALGHGVGQGTQAGSQPARQQQCLDSSRNHGHRAVS